MSIRHIIKMHTKQIVDTYAQRRNIGKHVLIPEKPIVAFVAVSALQTICEIGIETVIETIRIIEDAMKLIGYLFFDLSLILWLFLRTHLASCYCSRLLGRCFNGIASDFDCSPSLIYKLRSVE